MSSGVVFVEEASAAEAVAALATRLGFRDRVQIIPHEGKSDLERSFSRKIAAWRFPADIRFVVARDNDGANCTALKHRLQTLVPTDIAPRVKIRLVMQQLESWYLGDLEALALAGLLSATTAMANNGRGKFREPDRLTNASEIFGRLCGAPGKIAAARSIGPYLIPDRNRSISLGHFVDALHWATEGERSG